MQNQTNNNNLVQKLHLLTLLVSFFVFKLPFDSEVLCSLPLLFTRNILIGKYCVHCPCYLLATF